MGIKSFIKKLPGIKQYNAKFDSVYTRLDNIEAMLKSMEKAQLENYMDVMQKSYRCGGFVYDRIREIQSLTAVSDADVKYVRVGRDYDGGYVMADAFSGIRVAYSIGICDDVSWDKDMAERGIEVFMYDHTIDGLPEEHKRFHFHKVGIGAESRGNIKSLDDMISENGHLGEDNMLLKLDVEGCEWESLEKTASLGKFSQIAIELHGMCDVRNEKIPFVLRKLAETHVPVHIHANNCSPVMFYGDAFLPDALEITYLRKTDFEFSENKRHFPTVLDMPNDKSRPEIVMGMWQ